VVLSRHDSQRGAHYRLGARVKTMYPTNRHGTCVETSIRCKDGVVRPYWFCGDDCPGCERCGDLCAEMDNGLCCDCQRLCPGCGEDVNVGTHGMSEYGGCV
jgi:hypothetical protein